MVKLKAVKDGKGNIIISENSFEHLLSCLDNQKFVGEGPINGDSIAVGKEEYYKVQNEIQDAIDNFNRQCRELLHYGIDQPPDIDYEEIFKGWKDAK